MLEKRGGTSHVSVHTHTYSHMCTHASMYSKIVDMIKHKGILHLQEKKKKGKMENMQKNEITIDLRT